MDTGSQELQVRDKTQLSTQHFWAGCGILHPILTLLCIGITWAAVYSGDSWVASETHNFQPVVATLDQLDTGVTAALCNCKQREASLHE